MSRWSAIWARASSTCSWGSRTTADAPTWAAAPSHSAGYSPETATTAKTAPRVPDTSRCTPPTCTDRCCPRTRGWPTCSSPAHWRTAIRTQARLPRSLTARRRRHRQPPAAWPGADLGDQAPVGRTARPGPPMRCALALLILSSRAWVGHDLTEVVDEVMGSAPAAEDEVVAAQQRPVLGVAAEVGGRSRQAVAEPKHAAVVALLIRNAVLEGAEERVERNWRSLVRGREQRASRAGRPVAAGLDSRQVSLERYS